MSSLDVTIPRNDRFDPIQVVDICGREVVAQYLQAVSKCLVIRGNSWVSIGVRGRRITSLDS